MSHLQRWGTTNIITVIVENKLESSIYLGKHFIWENVTSEEAATAAAGAAATVAAGAHMWRSPANSRMNSTGSSTAGSAAITLSRIRLCRLSWGTYHTLVVKLGDTSSHHFSNGPLHHGTLEFQRISWTMMQHGHIPELSKTRNGTAGTHGATPNHILMLPCLLHNRERTGSSPLVILAPTFPFPCCLFRAAMPQH